MRPNKLTRAVIGILLLGAGWGILSFFQQTPASMAVMFFVGVAFLGSALLFRRRGFFSAAIAGVFTVTLFAATIIITEFAKMEFTIDFPDVVFYEPVKSQALYALLVFTCLFNAFLLWATPTEWPWEEPSPAEKSFARTTWWLFLLVALVMAALNTRGELITKTAYHSVEWEAHQGEAYAGVDAIWTMLGICALSATIRGYGVHHRFFRFTLAILLLAILYFRLLRGERSTAFGFMVFLVLLYYTISTSKRKEWVILGCIPLGFIFLIAWANVRGSASEKGLWQAVAEGATQTTQDIQEGTVARLDRFPKITWDMMETTFLYENGIRRGGETYRNLIPQQVPSFVAELIGYERPLSEPWVLAKYFEHGGGIFMVAEAYWNFRLAGVMGLALVLGLVCVGVEKFYRRLPPVFTYGYYGTIVLSAENVLVGVQSFVRGLEIAFFVTAVGWLLFRTSQGRARGA